MRQIANQRKKPALSFRSDEAKVMPRRIGSVKVGRTVGDAMQVEPAGNPTEHLDHFTRNPKPWGRLTRKLGTAIGKPRERIAQAQPVDVEHGLARDLLFSTAQSISRCSLPSGARPYRCMVSPPAWVRRI